MIKNMIILLVTISPATFSGISYQEIPADTLITLERTLCLGTCPSYTLSVTADGTVTFDGRDHVKTKGLVKSIIPKEKLKQLIAEFDRIQYFSLKDEYTEPGNDCPEHYTCSSWAVTSIQQNGKVKSVNHYNGCMGTETLKALTRLESRIDEIVNTQRWIK